MMRPGFSLVEIIVAVAISGFVMIMIFNGLTSLKKSADRYNELIALDTQQELLYRQLFKDISGMVIPLWGFISESSKPEERQKKQQEYNARFGMQLELENERLKNFSMVTTSVVGTYGVVKPRVVRVRYTLVEDPRDTTLFVMQRQEFPLSDKGEQGAPSFTLATGIKKCTGTCTLISQDEQGKKKVQEVSAWSVQEAFKNQAAPGTQKFEQQITLPRIITLKGIMVADSGHEYPFDFAFIVPIDSSQQERNEKAPEQKPEQGPGKAPANSPQKTAQPQPGGLLGALKPQVAPGQAAAPALGGKP